MFRAGHRQTAEFLLIDYNQSSCTSQLDLPLICFRKDVPPFLKGDVEIGFHFIFQLLLISYFVFIFSRLLVVCCWLAPFPSHYSCGLEFCRENCFHVFLHVSHFAKMNPNHSTFSCPLLDKLKFFTIVTSYPYQFKTFCCQLYDHHLQQSLAAGNN